MKADAVIASIIAELDDEQAIYQELFMKYHGSKDVRAQHVHKQMVDLCKLIRKELEKAG